MNKTLTILEVKEEEYQGKKQWGCKTAEGWYNAYSFAPSGMVEHIQAHLNEPIEFIVSEKEKEKKAGGKYIARTILGIPGLFDPPARDGGGRGKDEAFIQERMDRRTALMSAKDVAISDKGLPAEMFELADQMYAWLRSPLNESRAGVSEKKAGVAVAPFGEDQTRPSTVRGSESQAYPPSAQDPDNVDAPMVPLTATGSGVYEGTQGVTEDVAELGTTGEGVSGSAAPTEAASNSGAFNNDPYWPVVCCPEHGQALSLSQMVRYHREVVEKAVTAKQLGIRYTALARMWLDKAKVAS